MSAEQITNNLLNISKDLIIKNRIMLMEGMVVIMGFFFSLFGIYGYFHPFSARDLVSEREWQRTPEQAERKHKTRVKMLAMVFVVFGIIVFAVGLVL